MLAKTRDFLRSFSFRTGAFIFVMLSVLLIALRIQFYHESINTALANIHTIVEAHEADIEQALRENNESGNLDIIQSILRNSHDRHVYLELKDRDEITGNLPEWQFDGLGKTRWSEIVLPGLGEGAPRRLLLKSSRYSDDISLVVGYDLEKIAELQESLLSVLIINVILAFVAALIISAISVWMVNLKLRKVNWTAEAVILGNLSDRIPVLQTTDQFDKLALNINRMLDWIVKLLDISKYASNALAHDMRTPLSRHRIKLRALAERDDVPEQIRQEILLAVERVDLLADMFSNISNIAKAESRESAELFGVFDIVATVRDVVELYGYELEQNGQHLKLDLPEAPIDILGDKQLIGQAIANLLDNAGKYALAGATIRVSLVRSGPALNRSVFITVADNGPGIPADMREKVTQRFFRLEQSRHTEGSGLGLSLVNAVAGLHQGRFYIEDNRPGVRAVLRLSANIRQTTGSSRS